LYPNFFLREKITEQIQSVSEVLPKVYRDGLCKPKIEAQSVPGHRFHRRCF